MSEIPVSADIPALLPCPLCGGKVYFVGLCIYCDCGLKKTTTPEPGVRARNALEWNRRTTASITPEDQAKEAQKQQEYMERTKNIDILGW